ncbi:hypothetical protein FZEAL_32 [Fusarium zealandicum]|uniref:Ankyrin n=1 Tax=Fusarium zealandicum TaxID=1053134 RepID=A0A8H4UW05_9HYPO|nr:hypothetical protein FZEAL_32 [Fusarium zealandicum]
MEVLGAVATCIALAQTLAAGPKVISFFREMPEIQDDFEDLRKESLKAVIGRRYTAVRTTAFLVLTHAIDRWSSSAACRHASMRGGRAGEGSRRRPQWGLEKLSRRIGQQRIEGEKEEMATSERKDPEAPPKCATGQAEMRRMFMSYMQMTTTVSTTPKFCNKIEPPSYTSLEETGDREQEQIPAASDALELYDVQNRISHEHTWKGSSSLVQQNTSIDLQTLVPLSRRMCSEECRCRCHFSESTYKIWSYLQPLLGSWLIRCENVPKHRRLECTHPSCQKGDFARVRMDYKVPTWLLSTWRHFSVSYHGLGGIRCSLRPSRVISADDDIWANLTLPGAIAQKRISEGPRFYPDDHDDFGNTLITHVINHSCFHAIEVLFRIWGGLLLDQEQPRAVLYRVNDMILSTTSVLTEHEIYLLQKLKSSVHDVPEFATTEVHRSIDRGEGLQEALRKQPWAINEFDETGQAPLLLACRWGQVDDVERLIAAQADVNQQDFKGWTPLISACYHSNLDCAKMLVKAKCNVHPATQDGTTALHLAARRNSPEMVALLLAAGASTTAWTKWGDTPLHSLASIDAPDTVGHNSALAAVRFDNLPSLRALIEAGASLLLVSHESRNILHLAATHSTLDTLTFLGDLNMSGIDHELRENDEDTPWGQFQFSIWAPDHVLGTCRRPSPAERQAFAQLYRGVRDRNLQHDISHLERALDALQQKGIDEARQSLVPLIRQKEEWKRKDLVRWYRAIDKRIQHGELDLAAANVEEYIAELKVELDRTIWNTPSKYDPYIAMMKMKRASADSDEEARDHRDDEGESGREAGNQGDCDDESSDSESQS